MPVPLPRIPGTPVKPCKPSVFKKVIDEYKKCGKGITGFILILTMTVVCSERDVILTISLVSLPVWILLIAPILRHIGNWMDDNL